MKHLGLILAALLASGVGIYLLVTTRPATTFNTIVAAAFIAAALWFMARLELTAFGDQCLKWWQGYRGTSGGAS